MYFVDHVCPQCGSASSAPVPAIQHGDAGIWVCSGCDRTYQVRVELEAIDIASLLEKKPATGNRSSTS